MGFCRTVRLKDILKLSGLGRSLLRLDIPESLLYPYSPIAKALVSTFWPFASAKILIHEAKDGPDAYLLLRRAGGSTARIMMLASRYGQQDAQIRDYVWSILLENALQWTGMSGLFQVVAKVPEDPDILLLFSRGGFMPVGQELLFGAPLAVITAPSTPLPGRPLTGGDKASFLRLYRDMVGKPGLEELWPIPLPAPWRRSQIEIFVWNDASQPAIFLATFGHSRKMLRILYSSGSRALLPGSLAWALNYVSRHQPRTVYVTVRENQQELGEILEEMGFKHLLTQSLQVRDVVRRVRAEKAVRHVPVRSLRPLINMSRVTP